MNYSFIYYRYCVLEKTKNEIPKYRSANVSKFQGFRFCKFHNWSLKNRSFLIVEFSQLKTDFTFSKIVEATWPKTSVFEILNLQKYDLFEMIWYSLVFVKYFYIRSGSQSPTNSQIPRTFENVNTQQKIIFITIS